MARLLHRDAVRDHRRAPPVGGAPLQAGIDVSVTLDAPGAHWETREEAPDLRDLRRVLYGLDAILRLHMAQEEELYVALGDEHPAAVEPAALGA